MIPKPQSEDAVATCIRVGDFAAVNVEKFTVVAKMPRCSAENAGVSAKNMVKGILE